MPAPHLRMNWRRDHPEECALSARRSCLYIAVPDPPLSAFLCAMHEGDRLILGMTVDDLAWSAFHQHVTETLPPSGHRNGGETPLPQDRCVDVTPADHRRKQWALRGISDALEDWRLPWESARPSPPGPGWRRRTPPPTSRPPPRRLAPRRKAVRHRPTALRARHRRRAPTRLRQATDTRGRNRTTPRPQINRRPRPTPPPTSHPPPRRLASPQGSAPSSNSASGTSSSASNDGSSSTSASLVASSRPTPVTTASPPRRSQPGRRCVHDCEPDQRRVWTRSAGLRRRRR